MKNMTKAEMRKEAKLPFLGPLIFNMQTMYHEPHQPNNFPAVGAWIFCMLELTSGLNFCGIYKWQETDNPKNIISWCHIRFDATTGEVRYVEYKHNKDPQIILVCDERQADLIRK